jgi:primosomal protein N' (replication factor Y)
LLAASQDFINFYEKEIEVRKLFDYPPFSRLIKISFSGTDSKRTLENAQAFRQALIQRLPAECELHPPVPCGHAKIKDRFRFQFLIKSPKDRLIAPIIDQVKKQFPFDRQTKVLVDVDPLSTFF